MRRGYPTGEQLAGWRAGSGAARHSIDGSLSARPTKEPGQQQGEQPHAVVLGLDTCSVVHADAVRDCVGRGVRLFRPGVRENRCQLGPSALMSEQSRGRNNRRCSDVGTTPNLSARGSKQIDMARVPPKAGRAGRDLGFDEGRAGAFRGRGAHRVCCPRRAADTMNERVSDNGAGGPLRVVAVAAVHPDPAIPPSCTRPGGAPLIIARAVADCP